MFIIYCDYNTFFSYSWLVFHEVSNSMFLNISSICKRLVYNTYNFVFSSEIFPIEMPHLWTRNRRRNYDVIDGLGKCTWVSSSHTLNVFSSTAVTPRASIFSIEDFPGTAMDGAQNELRRSHKVDFTPGVTRERSFVRQSHHNQVTIKSYYFLCSKNYCI